MLLGCNLAYDTDTMVGRTARDKMVIDKVLETNKYLEIAVYDDESAIDAVLNAGRKLHIRKEGDEIRVIDLICYIATEVYKDRDDSKRLSSP